jgi:RecA-family ATPase
MPPLIMSWDEIEAAAAPPDGGPCPDEPDDIDINVDLEIEHTHPAIASCLRTIVLAQDDKRRRVFDMMAREAFQYATTLNIDRRTVVDKLHDIAFSTGLVDEFGDDEITAAISAAAKPRTDESPAWADRPAGGALTVITADTLHGKQVPTRPFLLHGSSLIPARTVTILTGDGGTGKSLLALQLAVAVSANVHWLGMTANPGVALYLSAEDEIDEVHRRLADIVEHHGISLADLASLHIVPLAGEDAILAAPAVRTNIIETTKLWKQVVSYVEAHKPNLIVFDTLADLFGGDENQRAQARQFVGLLRGIAIKHDATVVMLAHPSLTGMANGTGSSGNTGWSNSVRSRLYLSRVLDDERIEPDVDLRLLKSTKANYGRTGDQIRVRWSDGVFVAEQGAPVGALDRLAADQAAEHIFLDCLRLTLAQGRQFSPSRSIAYAPANFARMPEAKGYRANVLALAMERLLSAGKIKVEMVGRPSHQKQVLAVSSPPVEDGE